ncbi:MAG: hypothetical protein QW035_04625 [Candidatus Anstonellales archaeon]
MINIVVDLRDLSRETLSKRIEEIEDIWEKCTRNVQEGVDFSVSVKTDEKDFAKINISYIPTEKRASGDEWQEEKGKEVGRLLILLARLKAIRGDYRQSEQ